MKLKMLAEGSRPTFSLLFVIWILISSVAIAQPNTIAGKPRVIDGDTIHISGQKVRIHGVDAPEIQQTCQRGGVEWLCGQEASKAMRTLVVTSKTVKCEVIDTDRYGRAVGICMAGDQDIGKALVSLGLALAYRKYSKDYIGAETSAKASQLGLWSGQFVPPWDWRRGMRLGVASANDNEACEIKGNISRSGERIYHVPNGYYYAQTSISSEKGERYFCSEDEAKAAGWRKSKK